MKNLLILFFCYNIGYSQYNLNDIVSYINENKLVDTIEMKSLKKIKNSKTLDSLFNFGKKTNSLPNKDLNFSLFENAKYKVLEIQYRKTIYFHYIVADFKKYKLFISVSGDFILYDKEKQLMFYIHSRGSSSMLGYIYPDKILSLESIYYLDDNFNVLTSLILANDYSFCSSRYTYNNDKVIEELFIDKPTEVKNKKNISEMKLDLLLTFLDGPLTFSFYRKITLEYVKNKKHLFWFLNPNLINHTNH